MGGGWFNRQDPWFPAFVLSAAALVSTTLALLTVFYRLSNDSSSTVAAAPAAPTAGATEPALSPDISLLYAGPLPGVLAGSNLRPVSEGKKADLTFVRGVTDGTVSGYYVPVAALGAGVDRVSGAQMTALLNGTARDWAAVGGLPGRVVLALVEGESAPDWATWMLTTGAVRFASYAALRAAMTPGSGMLALVPVSEARAAQMAIAVDGVDPVRGRGDVAGWPFVERVGVSAATRKGEQALDEVRAALSRPPAPPVTIVATGDILQSRCSLVRIRETGDWAAALRGPVAEYLAAADLALGSLDGSIQDIGAPFGCVETTNLTSPPEVMEALTVAGIDEVTVATNHVFDCGQAFCDNRAFLRTLELLSAAGIKYAGGGANLEAALAPVIFEVNGLRIGVLGFDDIAAEDLQATATAAGTAPLDDSYADEQALQPRSPAFYQPAEMLGLSRFTERIRQLKAQVDIVVVQVQSGTEDTHAASPRSIKALRAAADAGADLVVGNQAHWVQGVETRGDAFIAYALGNFVFDQTHTREHTQGYLLEATFRGKTLAAVRLVPYQIEDKFRPVFATGETRRTILKDVYGASAELPAR